MSVSTGQAGVIGRIIHDHVSFIHCRSPPPPQGFIPKAIVDIATDPQPMLIHTVACALDKDTTGRFKVGRSGCLAVSGTSRVWV